MDEDQWEGDLSDDHYRVAAYAVSVTSELWQQTGASFNRKEANDRKAEKLKSLELIYITVTVNASGPMPLIYT